MGQSLPQKKLSAADDLFSNVIEEENKGFSESELRLLSSGYKALWEKENEPINKREFAAIISLIAYVAYNQKVDESKVTQIFLTRYNVKKIEDVPAKSFMGAVEYLVDLEIDKVMN